MIKNANINEESIKAMKEFRQKQIQSNIKLHIIFLVLIILLNLGLIIFILIFKTKIKNIKSKTDINSSSINTDKDSINNYHNEISHRLINIMANSYNGYYHFSLIFETQKEVDAVKNYIVDYFNEKKINIDKDKLKIDFKYQGFFEGDSFSTLRTRIYHCYRTFFLIQTNHDMKFGFFIEDDIILDKKKRYVYKENNCFLISFQKEGRFNCIGKKNKLEIKNDDDGIIIIGDDDIIIKNNYLEGENYGVINYPFKSFDVSTINSNIFTEENGAFTIKGIEIFSFDYI